MFCRRIPLVGIACALGGAIACSQSRAAAATTAGGQTAEESAADPVDTTSATPIDCGKVFSPSDAAGLLDPPVTVSAIGEGTGWCNFGNEKLGSITVRTGSDQENAMIFNAATVRTDPVKYIPLSGVGDEAVRKASDGSEIASKKGSLYCSVTMAGEPDVVRKLGGDGLAKRLGALCSKVYSAK